jgi:hypothetical protein
MSRKAIANSGNSLWATGPRQILVTPNVPRVTRNLLEERLNGGLVAFKHLEEGALVKQEDACDAASLISCAATTQ